MTESSTIEPSALWLALSSKEPPSQVVDFPRYRDDGTPYGKIRIRPLSQEEQMISSSASEKFVREHLKEAKKDDLGYERMFADAFCVEALFRACRDADEPKRPAFPSPKAMRQTLSVEECGALFQHYLTIQTELGPIVSHMGDDEIERWIARLVEGGSAYPFDLLSSELQRVLLLHMAYRLRSSPTDSASAGPQHDESTTDEPSSSRGSDVEVN